MTDFDPQNAFERSLERATSDPTHRPQFYRDFADAEFFITQAVPAIEGSRHRVIAAEESIQVGHIDWNGKSSIPGATGIHRDVLQSEARRKAPHAHRD